MNTSICTLKMPFGAHSNKASTQTNRDLYAVVILSPKRVKNALNRLFININAIFIGVFDQFLSKAYT